MSTSLFCLFLELFILNRHSSCYFFTTTFAAIFFSYPSQTIWFDGSTTHNQPFVVQSLWCRGCLVCSSSSYCKYGISLEVLHVVVSLKRYKSTFEHVHINWTVGRVGFSIAWLLSFNLMQWLLLQTQHFMRWSLIIKRWWLLMDANYKVRFLMFTMPSNFIRITRITR